MIRDFIGVYPNVASGELCDRVINLFDMFDAAGVAKTRQQHENFSKLLKDDRQLFLPMEKIDVGNYAISNDLIQCVWNAYAEYASEYDVLKDLGEHRIFEIKIQRTHIGGGYHVWHCENSARETSHRLLAFTIYLNDVDEGGETEFLYIPKRVQAKRGTVCLFPASFTHTHRGNPPISNTKYIATGWIVF